MRKVIVLFAIFVLAPVSIFAQEKVAKPIEAREEILVKNRSRKRRLEFYA